MKRLASVVQRAALGAGLMTAVAVGVVAPLVAQENEIASLISAARSDARNPAAHAALGRALLRAGRYREADAAYRRAASLRRGNEDALYDVARVAMAQGDYRRARAACEPLRRVNKTGVLAQVCSARAFLIWNRSARAFEDLEAALAQSPNHPEALLALGDANRLRAQVAPAEDAYRRAASAAPTSAEPYLGLARLYLAAGRRNDAITALRRGISLDASHPDIQFELGRLLGSAPEGRDLLTRAVQARPTWAEAQASLGDALLAAGDAAAAERAFAAAVRINRGLADAHVGMGRAKMVQGDLAGAEAAIERSLVLVPNSAAAVLALADIYARTDRVEDALEKYREAADLDQRNPEPLLRASRLAIEMRRDVFASGFLDRLLESQPNLAPALALYGDVMRTRNDPVRARDYYERALRGEGEIDRPRVEASLRALPSAPTPPRR